jgi:hypothetical protein
MIQCSGLPERGKDGNTFFQIIFLGKKIGGIARRK